MQLKAIKPVAILILLNIIGGIFCSLNAQPNSLPAVSKSTILKDDKSMIDRLVIAGALIAAEIDRLNAESQTKS